MILFILSFLIFYLPFLLYWYFICFLNMLKLIYPCIYLVEKTFVLVMIALFSLIISLIAPNDSPPNPVTITTVYGANYTDFMMQYSSTRRTVSSFLEYLGILSESVFFKYCVSTCTFSLNIYLLIISVAAWYNLCAYKKHIVTLIPTKCAVSCKVNLDNT